MSTKQSVVVFPDLNPNWVSKFTVLFSFSDVKQFLHAGTKIHSVFSVQHMQCITHMIGRENYELIISFPAGRSLGHSGVLEWI